MPRAKAEVVDNMQEQQVDILLATYNGEAFVEQQIRSIQEQTYSCWRLLVSDDCSSDGTLETVRRMAALDERICIVSHGVKHGSAKANFFDLMNYAEAPYVMFCDQDDFWLPEKVALSVNELLSLEDGDPKTPCMIYTDLKVVDDNLEPISDSLFALTGANVPREELCRCLIDSKAWGCTIAANQVLVREAARLREVSSVVMHDTWLRMVALALGRVRFINKSTILYRQHSDNVVGVRRFSVLGAAKAFSYKKSVARWQNVSECASLLLHYYGDAMTHECRDFLSRCEGLYSLSPMKRILFLKGNDMCVDRFAERAAQLIVVALSPRMEKPLIAEHLGRSDYPEEAQ